MLQESLNVLFRSLQDTNIPLLLPANLKAAKVRIIPNISWERSVLILPCVGSGLCMVIREPDAVTICCSFVAANCPSIACVMEVGGCIVREYMNIEDVVAIAGTSSPEAVRPFSVHCAPIVVFQSKRLAYCLLMRIARCCCDMIESFG